MASETARILFEDPDGYVISNISAKDVFGTEDVEEICLAGMKYRESKTISKALGHLKRYVAMALGTDEDHLDPKDVMRFDRDVYDLLYTYDDE